MWEFAKVGSVHIKEFKRLGVVGDYRKLLFYDGYEAEAQIVESWKIS